MPFKKLLKAMGSTDGWMDGRMGGKTRNLFELVAPYLYIYIYYIFLKCTHDICI